MTFPFEISKTDGRARTGVLKTPRGDIRTPAFMPVGTAATVKALTVDQVKQTGADILLGNTYHLMLRPGPERMERLGGLAVGEGHEAMCEVLDYAPDMLPADRPRYLMGVGKPIDLVEAVWRGVDMFDCVLPTRAGRHGQAWTWNGPINLKNARFAEDQDPLDPEVPCPASQDYSKAYLHHLIRTDEILGKILLSWHNIAFFQALTAAMRAAISEGRFDQFRADFHARHTSN